MQQPTSPSPVHQPRRRPPSSTPFSPRPVPNSKLPHPHHPLPLHLLPSLLSKRPPKRPLSPTISRINQRRPSPMPLHRRHRRHRPLTPLTPHRKISCTPPLRNLQFKSPSPKRQLRSTSRCRHPLLKLPPNQLQPFPIRPPAPPSPPSLSALPRVRLRPSPRSNPLVRASTFSSLMNDSPPRPSACSMPPRASPLNRTTRPLSQPPHTSRPPQLQRSVLNTPLRQSHPNPRLPPRKANWLEDPARQLRARLQAPQLRPQPLQEPTVPPSSPARSLWKHPRAQVRVCGRRSRR